MAGSQLDSQRTPSRTTCRPGISKGMNQHTHLLKSSSMRTYALPMLTLRRSHKSWRLTDARTACRRRRLGDRSQCYRSPRPPATWSKLAARCLQ